MGNNRNSDRFNFLGLQNHCRPRCLLLVRKFVKNLDSVLNITLLTKVRLVKAVIFPVVMYECEAEGQRIDVFELWCWRRFFRVPWTARWNQSIIKEINPEYSLKRLMLKLQLQYFGHLMQRVDSLEKTYWGRLKVKGEGGGRGWNG